MWTVLLACLWTVPELRKMPFISMSVNSFLACLWKAPELRKFHTKPYVSTTKIF